MSYLIQAFTFDSPVPVLGGFPFTYQSGALFSQAQQTDIYLADPGDSFDRIVDFNPGGQELLEDLDLGQGEVVNAGTPLTFRVNTVSEVLQPGTNHLYYVFIPHQATGSINSPAPLGGGRTVFVIAAKGTPPLDPQKDYNWDIGNNLNRLSTDHREPPQTCFATGTLIATANGMRAVETLVAGDLVRTRDRGLRPVAWAGGRHLPARELDAAPHLRPILIRAGALGPGLPAHDLTVSPQHRVLIHSKIAARLVGQAEALVAAKHLTGLPGIAVLNPCGGVGYHHLLFDRHELVWSNGCWTESLFTGPQAMAALGSAARREIRAILPQLFDGTAPTGARHFLTGREGRELTRRHLKHGRALVMQADD